MYWTIAINYEYDNPDSHVFDHITRYTERQTAVDKIASTLEALYPGRWEAFNDEQWTRRGAGMGERPMAVIRKHTSQLEFARQQSINWQNKIKDLQGELVNAHKRRTDWQIEIARLEAEANDVQ